MEKIIYSDITEKDLEFFSGEEKTNAKRCLRTPLLKAFDVYKTNIFYGIEVETKEEKDEIIKWYNSLLNLEENALIVVPSGVKKYL